MKTVGSVLLACCCVLTSCVFVTAQVSSSDHIFVIVEHNPNHADIIGNPTMPYLNSVSSEYQAGASYVDQSDAVSSDVVMLLPGQASRDSYTNNASVDNIVRQLLSAGATWKSYAEGLPLAGYVGDDTGSYVRAHNPFAYFPEVVNSSVQLQNLVPMTELFADLRSRNLPNLSFIVPDSYNDGHNGSLQEVDSWLKTNIAPILASPAFRRDGVLFIVFDESGASTIGGRDLLVLVVRPKLQPDNSDSAVSQPSKMLTSILTGLSVATYPGAGISTPESAGLSVNTGNDTTVCIGAYCPVGPLKGCVYTHSNNKYQAVKFRMNFHACVPFDAKLYYGSGCNPHSQADEFGYGRNLCLGGGWIFYFSDFPNQLNTSALWTIGNQQACFNYSSAPPC